MRRCPRCSEQKPIEDFAVHRGRRDGLQVYCRACYSSIHKERYENPSTGTKERVLSTAIRDRERNSNIICQYLGSHPCVDCGEADPFVLQFDHVSGKKITEISKLRRGASTEVLLSEIAKCEVRCANCHLRVTAQRAGWTKCGLTKGESVN